MKSVLLIVLISSLAQLSLQKSASIYKAKMSVYYDTFCAYSVQFIMNQLYPVMKLPIAKYIELELVPYGSALTKYDSEGKLNFTCTHGQNECEKDRFQGCVIQMYKQELAVDFVYCSSKNRYNLDSDKKCCKDLDLDYQTLQSCASGALGARYMEQNGKTTLGLKPRITRVPYIIFNDHYDLDKWYHAFGELQATVCKEIGEELCKNLRTVTKS